MSAINLSPPKIRKNDGESSPAEKQPITGSSSKTGAKVDYFKIEEVSSSKCFKGLQKVFKHQSKVLSCEMKFSIYLPSTVLEKPEEQLPVIYFLSGLTCTEQNFIIKSGFQRHANKHDLIVVGPDTSPRGPDVPTSEDGSWDLGLAASFYLDATQPPYNKHYKMYSYITKELREVVEKNFACIDRYRVGISGHSMGGHGALVCYLRNPQIYRAVSAFAPISNPISSAWGKKAFAAYLGPDEKVWKEFDATELVKRQPQKTDVIFIDQGDKDEWTYQLNPDNFVKACEDVEQPIRYKLREGYDHGYHYVSTFIGEHMKFFADLLHS